MTNSKIWKLLTLVELVDTLVPDNDESPTIIRTAITKKQNANDINLNRTKTSKQAREIEDQLAADLEEEYKKIMADGSADFGVLQRRYGPEVEKVIRGAVQKLYLLGSDYVTKTLDTTAFITTKDLDNIKKAVARFSTAFWRRIFNAIHKSEFTIIPKTAQVGDPTVPPPLDLEEEEPTPSNPAADAAALAALIATMTVALSTLAKLDQLPPGEEKRKLVWVTEHDSKVCPICSSLQGQEWDEGDSDMPIPGPEPEGVSHHNCRCRLMIKMGDDILSG